jgi:hypothetical protein
MEELAAMPRIVGILMFTNWHIPTVVRGVNEPRLSQRWVVIWIYSDDNNNEFPWDINTCHFAAQGGHLDARQQGWAWNELTFAYAMKGNQLEVMCWLRDNGFRWDERSCNNAAMYNHLDALKWFS